jgi:hypothetical protein
MKKKTLEIVDTMMKSRETVERVNLKNKHIPIIKDVIIIIVQTNLNII